MARRGCVIERAVVEQELRFDREEYLNDYLHKLDYYDEPYKIVSKTVRNGYLYVIIRKRYGEYPFLGERDPYSLSEFWETLRDLDRGATRNEDGVLEITDSKKYQEWLNSGYNKSRY